jgi:DNA invertase Pin-like site-specific DNA recombinase
MQVIGYARVSKREQAEDSHALEQQQARLKAAGAVELFTDVESGLKIRPQFERVMELVRSQAVDVVVVTRIDRLGRSLPACRKALDDFRSAGVALRVLDGSIDLTTVGGRVQANLMAVLAEMESDMISDRAKHGWAYLRSRRVAMNPPFGYCKLNDRHHLDHQPFLSLLADRSEHSKAAIARDIVELYFEVRSLRATIVRLNEKYGLQRFSHAGPKTGFTTSGLFQWSPSGLRNWLSNPVLAGHLAYLRDRNVPVIHYDTHPDQALVTQTEFEQIQATIEHNRQVRGWGFRALNYPLSGLIFCDHCGGNCYSSKAGPRKPGQSPRQYYYFQCKNARIKACPYKQSIRMDAAETAVIAALRERAAQVADRAMEPDEVIESAEIRALRDQISGLERLGYNPAIERAIQDLTTQIEQLQAESRLTTRSQTAKRDDLMRAAASFDFWQELDNEEKRKLFHWLVRRLVVRGNEVVRVELQC